MRSETIFIYTFDELPDETKAKVRDNFRAMPDLWAWGEDYWQSAMAFEKIAPIEIIRADYSQGYVDTRWTETEEIGELSGLRGWKWLLNNGWLAWADKNKQGACTLTGFCGDCGFADAIAHYALTPLSVPDISQVFREACQAWVKDAQSDCEHAYTDGAIDELIACNEYEFHVNGDLV